MNNKGIGETGRKFHGPRETQTHKQVARNKRGFSETIDENEFLFV